MTTQQLPVVEAAQALGISVSALRRGLKRGKYQGQRQSTPQGFVWLVEVGEVRVSEVRLPEDRIGEVRVSDIPSQEAPVAPQMPLQAARAQEMAQYSQALLAPYVAQIAEQAEEIGKLKAQLAERDRGHARTQSAPLATRLAGRSWWQRLVWG